MITTGAIAFMMLARQEPDPNALYEQFIEEHPNFTAAIEVRLLGAPEVGFATIEVRNPIQQRFRIQWMGESHEFRQSEEGIIYYDHALQRYQNVGKRTDRLLPDGDWSFAGYHGYPDPLTVDRLAQIFLDMAEFKHVGAEEVNGKPLQVMQASVGMGHTYKVFLGEDGRPLRMVDEIIGQQGIQRVTIDVLSYRFESPEDNGAYSNRLWPGYEPHHHYIADVLDPGYKAQLGKWLEATGVEEVDVAARLAGQNAVILFTAPDCIVTARFREAFDELFSSLGKEYRMIEVSLGAQRPELGERPRGLPVYWDRDGAIEAAFGIPGTPYLVTVTPDDAISANWFGFDRATAKSLSAAIKEAIKASEELARQ